MKLTAASIALAFLMITGPLTAGDADLTNPAIDMAGHLRVAHEAALHRQTRLVSEEEFLRISRTAGAVILDARSRQKYDELHVKGAVNLSFPDITAESLARVIANSQTPVLIYCNNNFAGALGPFPTKIPTASLNLSTYAALYDYGYRNVYELAPLVDLRQSQLSFESRQTPPVARVNTWR